MEMWASEPEAVGAGRGGLVFEHGAWHRRRARDREDQWRDTFDNRDGTAVDALAMRVSMATSCRWNGGREPRLCARVPGLSRPRARMAACTPHGHNRRTLNCLEIAMRPALLACVLSLFAFDAIAAPLPSPADLATIASDVKAAETAFAKTMADRNFDRFADFVADDAVFNGNKPHIGRAAVVETWKGFFDAPQAPFSWAPDAVAASADGRYAVSTGLARDAAGRVISRFTTIWRKDGDGRWRVVVDQGVDVADCAAPPK